MPRRRDVQNINDDDDDDDDDVDDDDVDDDDDADYDDDDADDDDADGDIDHGGGDDDDDDADEHPAGASTKRSALKDEKKKTRLRKEAQQYSKSLEKRGVIYMSRIPPGMKPNKARTLFEQFGEVTRIFLQEEDAALRSQRRASGGNGSKQFKEGWIEFADKAVAKSVAESLNNTAIGGCKSHAYHDDIWNLKYLKKFKWDYLTEKCAYERRVREAKLRAAMMQAKRSNAEFVELVEKGKQERFVEERKRKRQEGGGGGGDTGGKNGDGEGDGGRTAKIKRSFKQVQPISRDPNGLNANFVDNKLINAVFSKR